MRGPAPGARDASRLTRVSETTTRARTLLDSGSGIAVAMAVMNVATYGYTIIAARFLGPGRYGAFWAMMSLLLVVSVVSLGLQTTAARRITAYPDNRDQIETVVLRVSLRASVALGAVLLLLAPAINLALNLDDLLLAAMAGPAAVPLTLMGAQAGVLQGERRWLPLGVLFVSAGVPRLLVGTALLWWHASPEVAFLGVLVGSLVPVAWGTRVLRRTARGPGSTSMVHRGRSVLRETLQNSQALFAFFALSNLDIVVARNVLDTHEAGLYAGGLLLAKAMVFLPQFVVVVAFPSMASTNERARALTWSLGLVGGLGATATAVTALAPDLVLLFVGGSQYAEVSGQLWLFALLGTVLAMVQLVVYSVIARRGQRSVYLVWAALVAMVVGGALTSDRVDLLAWVLTVDVVLLVALVAISYHHLYRRAEAPLEPSTR